MSVVIAEIGERSVWLAGDMRLIRLAMNAAGVRHRSYDRERRAVVIPLTLFDDVRAALELQFGADVRLEQVKA